MRPNEFSKNANGSIKGTELAASMAVVIGERLRKSGVAHSEADEIALAVLDEVRSQYGGQNIYFAKEDKSLADARNEEILKRFQSNELSVPEIAIAYGISMQWAYNIIRRGRAQQRLEREKNQQMSRTRSKQRWKNEGGIGDGA